MKKRLSRMLATILTFCGPAMMLTSCINEVDNPVVVPDNQLEPSTTLTELRKTDECTIYTFTYPSVSATGKPTLLSSALFAWTPKERQQTDSIESLHILCHFTITADNERPTTTSGMSNEQNLLQFLPGREYTNFTPDGEANYVGRCIIIAPDYEGYGETKDMPHPYLAQRLTAQQLLDTGVLGWLDSKAYAVDDIDRKWYDQLQAGVDTLGRHYTPEQMAELFESPKVGNPCGQVR